jgi:hypothetical protein
MICHCHNKSSDRLCRLMVTNPDDPSSIPGATKFFEEIDAMLGLSSERNILRSSVMRSRPERDPQQTAQCVYSITCECGRSYIAETG